MSGWISSKLKVAETFLQQIDQQAAESLRKGDQPEGDESNNVSIPRSIGGVPLKDQLKKRGPETDDLVGKLENDPNFSSISRVDLNNEIRRPTLTPKPNLTDGDWTQLLSSPNQSAPSTSSHGNGVSSIRGLRKIGRKSGSVGSKLSGSETKRNQKINLAVPKTGWRSNVVNGGSLIEKGGDATEAKQSSGESPFSADTPSSAESQSSGETPSNDKFQEGQETAHRSTDSERMVESENDGGIEDRNGGRDIVGNGEASYARVVPEDVSSQLVDEGILSGSGMKCGTVDMPKKANEDPPMDMKRAPALSSDERSDSELDSDSTSGSESEHEREEMKKRRQQIMAERVVAKSIEAIKERENMVARLEGEKESLEKILEERAKQQVQEASELQTTMMETMEAVEKEKQKHNNTRMEVFTRLAKLEMTNADLAKSLALSQWNLEVEVNRVAEIRQQLEVKQAAHEELKRRISSTNHAGTSLNQLVASKGLEFEREILEAEYSFIIDKIVRLQEKAKNLEANIEITQKEMENPTEVEVELKRRLGQLTDHLIQKQAQVEALSSEKATLQLRIEAVSRLLEENDTADVPSTSTRFDLESGKWDLSKAKLRPLFEARIRSGGQHLGSLLRQLDAIFSAGAVFLRRNPTARLWSAVYLVCLHFWVIYILMSHTPLPASDELGSGAVLSLENINNTGV